VDVVVKLFLVTSTSSMAAVAEAWTVVVEHAKHGLFIFIVDSFGDLVNGRLEGAYRTAQFGTSIITLMLMEILFILAFKEEFVK